MATTITPQIVNISVSVVTAAQPSQLQQSGAIVSCGGTTLTSGTYQYASQLSGVTSILAAPIAISTITWSSSTVTATTATALDLTVGDTFTTTIAGVTPAGYNGTFTATVASTTSFTYALTTNPGTETVLGTYTPPYSAFLTNAATTFFAQGSSVGVYVLELGAQTSVSTGISALTTWITNNLNVFYAYLVPKSWDGVALNTLAANYSSPTGKTYFFPTTTTGAIADYASNKAIIATVGSPTQASTEHQASALFYNFLVNNPTSAAPVNQMGFRYLYGVTPWNQLNNTTAINTVLTAYGNLILQGSEGGISTSCLYRGTTMDGEQIIWWYAVDWVQIQTKQALANAIINGSNTNPPLLYNQHGINTLQAVAQTVINTAIACGLLLSGTVSAISFATYKTDFPSNFNAGIYNGLSATIVPQTGFQSITFALTAVQFAG